MLNSGQIRVVKPLWKLAWSGLLLMVPLALAAGPKPIFDGKTFSGWNGETNHLWRIDAGELVGGSLQSMVPRNEFLATDRAYTNFVLRLKFRLLGTEGFVNSGVQFRSVRMPHDSEMIGYQADIGEGWYGCIYDESRRNKVMARPDPEAVKKALRPGEWNDYEVRAEGTRMRIRLNGVLMVDFTEMDPAIPQQGQLGLQVHGGGKTEVRFKEILLDELP